MNNIAFFIVLTLHVSLMSLPKTRREKTVLNWKRLIASQMLNDPIADRVANILLLDVFKDQVGKEIDTVRALVCHRLADTIPEDGLSYLFLERHSTASAPRSPELAIADEEGHVAVAIMYRPPTDDSKPLHEESLFCMSPAAFASYMKKLEKEFNERGEIEEQVTLTT